MENLINDNYFTQSDGDALRKSTRESYNFAVKQYFNFCQTSGYEINHESFLVFLKNITKKYKYSSVESYFYGIRYYFEQNNIPYNKNIFNNFLKAMKNQLADAGKQIKKKTPALTKIEIQKKINELSIDYREIVWCLYYGAFRASELLVLTPENITTRDSGYVITIANSKTYKRGVFHYKFIPANTPAGHAIKRRLEITKTNHKLFLQTRQAVTTTINRKWPGYTAHSLRAGFVTDAIISGATVEQVAEQTGHSFSGVQEYYRQIKPDRNNAVNML